MEELRLFVEIAVMVEDTDRTQTETGLEGP